MSIKWNDGKFNHIMMFIMKKNQRNKKGSPPNDFQFLTAVK